MANNATPTPRMIRAVYESFDTGRHSGDVVARRVMDRIVSWLVAGLELSPRLNAKLIDNINMRTRYSVSDTGRPYKLSRDQIQYAMKTSPEWFNIGLSGEDLPVENEREMSPFSTNNVSVGDDFPQVFRSLYDGITLTFRSFSTLFPQHASDLAQHIVSIAAQTSGTGTTSCSPATPKVMEWEGNKSNLVDEPMIRPEDDMQLASSPDMIAADAAHVNAITSPELNEQGAERDVDGSHCQNGNAHRDHGPKGEAEREVAVSFFHNKADAPPSANLELGPDKFALVFSDADHAEGQLHEVCTSKWLQDFANAGGTGIRRESRGAGTGKTRFRMSPLYDARDTFARKGPVEGDAVAVLFWNEDEQPDQVTVIRGEDVTVVPLTKFYGRHPKAPTHKGVLREKAA